MLIKVCGLRDPDNIRQVAAIGEIDLVGLIFYAQSSRYVDSEETAQIVSSLATVRSVGVFVNESPEVVIETAAKYHLNYLQLHGSESPAYLAHLQTLLPQEIKLIKAFSIREKVDLSQTSGYENFCEYLLFDTPTADYGGSGQSFDWSILQHYSGSTPFFLSGGIGAESVESLRHFHHPKWAGIDLNSRFESAPAMKNIPLLTNFVQQFKNNPI